MANNDHLAWFLTSASSTEDEMGKQQPTSLFRNNCFHCGLCPAPTFSNTLSTYRKTWIWDQGCSDPVPDPLSENVLRLSSTSLFSFQSLELSTVLEEGFYSKLKALRTFKYFQSRCCFKVASVLSCQVQLWRGTFRINRIWWCLLKRNYTSCPLAALRFPIDEMSSSVLDTWHNGFPRCRACV